jgi:sorting nexin-25
VRDSAKTLLADDSIVKYLDALKDAMWPEGKLKTSVERTPAQRNQSRKEAGVVLDTLVPELAASVVGRRNAANASRRVHAAMNNQRLK